MSTGNVHIQAIPEATAVADIVTKNRRVEVVVLDEEEDLKILAVPTHSGGVELKSIKPFVSEYDDAPERRKGIARFTELSSFVAHANRFKDTDSVLFADPGGGKTPSLRAVLDYHRDGATGAPRFGQHQGLYAFPVSDEWTAWLESNGNENTMNQQAFAEFIEDRIVDVVDPSSAFESARTVAERLGAKLAAPQRLLELSRGLSINVGATVANAVRLDSGESSVVFQTTHAGEKGAPLDIPSAFVIAIPVFRNGVAYQLVARLRYRTSGGAISWFYDLHRTDAAFDDAFREACDRAAKETGLPLLYGSPES